MKFTICVRFLLSIGLIAVFLGCGEDSPVDSRQTADEPRFSIVSGTITSARTGQPILGALVMMLDRRSESAVDGTYIFAQVDYSDALTVTVEALDYAGATQTFALNTEDVIVDIPLTPLTNPEEEIQEFLSTYSEFIGTMDINNLEEIEGLFTEGYIASDDLPTRFFGIDTGVIPAKFDAITASVTTLFEEFNLVQFRFYDIQMNITNTRKAFARLGVDIITEQGSRADRREIISGCEIHFRKEVSNWKIFFWQFFAADIRL